MACAGPLYPLIDGDHFRMRATARSLQRLGGDLMEGCGSPLIYRYSLNGSLQVTKRPNVNRLSAFSPKEAWCVQPLSMQLYHRLDPPLQAPDDPYTVGVDQVWG